MNAYSDVTVTLLGIMFAAVAVLFTSLYLVVSDMCVHCTFYSDNTNDLTFDFCDPLSRLHHHCSPVIF